MSVVRIDDGETMLSGRGEMQRVTLFAVVNGCDLMRLLRLVLQRRIRRTVAPSIHVAPISVARGNSGTPFSLLWI